VARALALVALLSLTIAAAIVIAESLTTSGYDPVTTTVSHLPAPGIDFAIGLMALACFALAADARSPVALVIAGIGFAAAASIHLDPTSVTATAGHRVASGAAVLGLTIAPFSGRYGRISVVLGAAEVAMLVAAAVLLTTPFAAWGAWERLLLALVFAWMVLVAFKIVSRPERARASKAASSSNASYTPVSSVNNANR
jgi:hypothetical protein